MGSPRTKKRWTLLTPQPSLVSAGTAQQITSSNIYVYSCVILAHRGNSGILYVGDSNVDSDNGIDLDAGDNLPFHFDHNRSVSRVFNLADIYFDGDTNGDKLVVMYTT